MVSTMARNTQKTFEELSNTSERTLPGGPFPRKYIHSVFNDRQEALQAAQVLREAGFNAGNIHVMTNSDYIEAVGRGQSFIGAFTSDDFDVYLDEARRGSTILAVRPSSHGQMERVRDLLAPHGAHCVKYIDTWTVAQLLP